MFILDLEIFQYYDLDGLTVKSFLVVNYIDILLRYFDKFQLSNVWYVLHLLWDIAIKMRLSYSVKLLYYSQHR